MADDRGYASNYMAELMRLGHNATSALQAYREAGGAIRTQTWYRGWGEVARSIADREQVALAPKDRRPVAGEISQWTTPSKRGFVYQVQTQVRAIGTSEVFTTMTSFRSDVLVPYQDAIEGALGYFADEAENYGEQVLGGVVTGVYELVGE